MFNLRRFFYQAVALSESDATSDENPPVFGNMEKTKHIIGYLPSSSWGSRARRRKLPLVIKLLLLTSVFAFVFFFGQSITEYATLAYHGILRSGKAHGHELCTTSTGISQEASVKETSVHQSSLDEPAYIAAPPWEVNPLDRTGWKATCSTNETGNDCSQAIDADGGRTDWKSKTGNGHWIMIDLQKIVSVHSLAMKPSSEWRDGGAVRRHRVAVSTNQKDWETVAFGTWRDSNGFKYATFEPRQAQYLNLSIIDSYKDKGFVAISDINIYALNTNAPVVAKEGRWTTTLNFPLVPVTAFLNPLNQTLITMASFREDHFQSEQHKNTMVATWDPTTGFITEENLDKTGHDMFCPGTSYDEKGQVMVTGGSTPEVFSFYSPKDGWINPSGWSMKVKIPRGYQGQTFLPDGRTFMIGGAWSGGIEKDSIDRKGEIFDPRSGTWRVMSNVSATHIKMDPVVILPCNDPAADSKCNKTEWRQHHAWLYAWKDDSIFHAGPSKKMHWISTKPVEGEVRDAGLRKDDGDAVCGVAAMYDAEEGLILTAGGAPNYHYWLDSGNKLEGHRSEATNNAFEIRLGKPGDVVEPKRLPSMAHKRIFANAVILPNGETLIVGGQSQGEPFHDETWEGVPEIYSPKTNSWRPVARHSTPRVYHSWAMLLPDATVLVGGSGLLQDTDTNHFDAQIYQPPYLFTADGKSTVQRPTISTIDKTATYKIGGNITITTDIEVDDASLIRYSAATHALNNDLRRIHAKLVPVGNPSDKKYSLAIPKDPGVALPGYWMLFALRNGVPSVSKTVQILVKLPNEAGHD